MRFKKIAILSSEDSWFVPYAKEFVKLLQKRKIQAKLFFNHKKISKEYEIVFILSYFKIIEKEFLSKHKHNIAVHESILPKGRGWAPLFWQILEGKNTIPIVLFEASEELDKGDIYIKDNMVFEGHELNEEIRKIQAKKTIELCLSFLDKYDRLKPEKQRGKPTFYKKRIPDDSELDINKTLKEQFNLLRIVNNEKFPAYFYYKKNKYILEIRKDGKKSK